MATSFENKTNSVLNHLIQHGSITSWEAIEKYRATRLSAIIFILKDRGWDIVTEMKYDTESKTRWGIYHLYSSLTTSQLK
jgi:hypothetical protein